VIDRRPFVDTHVHLHDMTHERLRYEWLDWAAPLDPTVGEEGAIRSKHYRAEDFLAEVRFQNVQSFVHVQAAIGTEDPVDETRWLQEVNDRLGVPHAAIAYVDLASDDAGATLERHLQFPIMRGVRDLRYDDYLDNPAWQRGLALMEGHELVLCDDPFIERMADMRRVVEEHPGVTVCIDHAGYPGFVGDPRRPVADFGDWRAAMHEIAKAENTVVKISGLGMSDRSWTPESLKPWIVTCIEAFGTKRAFFGTNWPLDRLYSSYGDVLDAYAAAIAEFTPDEQQDLFSRNAERIFRLPESNPR
jgi:predicted TIM-barrel fold metal-dependent hydrolase